MKADLSFIQHWRKTTENISEQHSLFLKLIQPLSKSLQKNVEENTLNEFNIFYAISDYYYRENFHSQILTYLLAYRSLDGKQILLENFIDCINLTEKVHLSKKDFRDCEITNEVDNIDIKIRSKSKKQSIIIENKINDAHDQPRQIPRYLAIEKKAGYEVKAIVYLPLVADKQPNKSKWKSKEVDEINQLLCIISAYDKREINLCTNWIQPSLLKSLNINLNSTLRQYQSLIKNLTLRKMDNVTVEKFYKEILDEDNYKTAKSIKKLLSGIPQHRARRMEAICRHKVESVFESISTWKHGGNSKGIWRTKFERPINSKVGFKLVLEVICNAENTEVAFWDNNGIKDTDRLNPLMLELGLQDKLIKRDEHWYHKIFPFPAKEKEMEELVIEILDALIKHYH